MRTIYSYLAAVTVVMAVGVITPENSFAATALLPIVRLLTALLGIGYVILQLTPLLFGKTSTRMTADNSSTSRIGLPLSEFCLWFIPAVVLLLVLVTVVVGFSRALHGEAVLIITACLMVVAGLLLPRKKVELTQPQPKEVFYGCSYWQVLSLLPV